MFNVKAKDHFNSFYVLLYEQYELPQYLQDLQAENNAFKKLIKERDQFIQFNKWKEMYLLFILFNIVIKQKILQIVRNQH